MKVFSLLTIIMLLLSQFAFSIGDNCSKGATRYLNNDVSSIDICTSEDGGLNFYANAGSPYDHTCNLEATAIKIGDLYVYQDENCKVTFKEHDGTIQINFSDGCNSYCGMRANWINGTFSK